MVSVFIIIWLAIAMWISIYEINQEHGLNSVDAICVILWPFIAGGLALAFILVGAGILLPRIFKV